MKRQKLTLLGLMVALFAITTVVDGYAQRRPVTTQPSGKKTPCEDKVESNVDNTPWKVTEIGYVTISTTPIDTADIIASAATLSNAVGGDLTNYDLIVDSLQGWMGTMSWTIHFQFTRTVTITLKEWKCIDGALVLVKDINKTFDETTPWSTAGPFTGADMSVKRFRALVTKQIGLLPVEYEGPME